MSEFSKLFKFKNMFNALELLVNIDGKDRKGKDFDTEAMRLDPKNCTEIEKWRNFYNRIKRVLRDSTDIRTYEKGEIDLRDELECSRKVSTRNIIIQIELTVTLMSHQSLLHYEDCHSKIYIRASEYI
jgi:hypothetical protein